MKPEGKAALSPWGSEPGAHPRRGGPADGLCGPREESCRPTNCCELRIDGFPPDPQSHGGSRSMWARLQRVEVIN